MIHSMAGGEIGQTTFDDYAKVKLLPPLDGIFWYKTILYDLKVGDIVFVPFGNSNQLVQGEILKIDKSVSSKNSPVPSKRAKYVFSKAEP